MYDAGSASDTAQLVNASTRAYVDTGDGVLVSGFVIDGDGSRRVLIRGVGPALGNFGVTGLLNDPTLKLFSGTTELNANDNWSDNINASAIAVAASAAGAFNINSGTADAALLIELPAGAYTAQVSGVANNTGTALLEIYLID